MRKAGAAWRKFAAWYHKLLLALLGISLGILIFPVTLQVFARFMTFLPHWIWTEELARLMFVWTIMIGSIVGVREGTHFVVDVWPRLSPRADAALRIVSRTGILIIGVVFFWMGIEFTRFAWWRISELAELPLWIIHIAWPVAGFSWILFLAEQFYDDFRTVLGSGE
ncbi:MAG TPA: TRAP transporter small permease [Aestuariivirgaceae bacterium]|nr:TRAP transporter small permease [Aestuariivirgaceae bacterium]